MPKFKTNKIYQGDCIEIMRDFPDKSVDLAFCDPPYNLEKAYNSHEDNMDAEAYLIWCEKWIDEYIRLLKPKGSLVIVNIPKWAVEHAYFLNKKLYFREWIAWDAMSVPRGYMMPAHYAILHYSKSNEDLNLNPIPEPHPNEWCLRPDCKEKQKELDKDNPLSDIWTDIHRIKHSGKRDEHPCQLPEKLLRRIIKLLTNKNDLVIDCMVGTGTTAVVAKKLSRKYIGIEIDKEYAEITRKKLKRVNIPLDRFED